MEVLGNVEGGGGGGTGGGGERELLVAPVEQAESVAEAIIRHQDLCEVGKITAVGQLVQLATIFGICIFPLSSLPGWLVLRWIGTD